MTWPWVGDAALGFQPVFDILNRHNVQPFLVVLIDDMEGNGSSSRFPMANTRGDFNLIGLDFHPTTAAIATLPAFQVDIDVLSCQG